MGEVYLVEHDVIGTQAALKVLLPEIATNAEAVERFIQEARASSGIGSPYIPRCYDFGYLPDQRAYVLMDLIHGKSVAAELQQTGPLPLADVKRIVLQTAEALAAAHELGIIHRDIKPEHIMVSRKNGLSVKILDFGIAKVVTENATRTQVGTFMGTPLYCAPEQVLGEPVGPATDIYSLGATAYEMLTGRPPFSGEAGHVLAIKAQRDPVSITQLRPMLPHAVVATIEKMMARDRAQRPASMREVVDEVATWSEQDRATYASEPAPASRRRWWVIGSIASVCVLGVAIAAMWPGDAELPRASATPTRPEQVDTSVAPRAVPTVPPNRLATTAPDRRPPEPSRTTKATVETPAAKPEPKQEPKQARKKDPPRTAESPKTRSSKPPATQPASGSADVLIVDPFK
jgi:serine/threonine-protein kinase